MFNLAGLYMDGSGVEKSPVKAYFLLSLSTSWGENPAAKMLWDYQHGIKPKNWQKGNR